MSILTACSTQPSVQEAVNEIKQSFTSINPCLIIFFASSSYAPEELSKQMKEIFSQSEIIGCSTAGEIISGKMLKNSVVAMALDKESIADIKVEIVEDLKQNSSVNIKKAFHSFEKHIGSSSLDWSPLEYVGIILIDGLSGSEEKVMDRIGDLVNIFFVGGSAGDDLKFSATYVYANGRTYTNAAVLAVLKPAQGFNLIKTQSFCSLDKKLRATKVNEETREILEFNDMPAANAYAEALNIPLEKIQDSFMHNPIGLMINNDLYVRSPQQVKESSMVFYCAVKQGMNMTLLKGTDIIKDTKEAVDKKLKDLGQISGIINFHCILRTLELEKKGQTEAYGQIFADIPTIGFSTYGEEYIAHINQTSTMLVIK